MKPHNGMVDANGRLHLMDFGLAARVEAPGEEKLTRDGTVMGTPAYMSPAPPGARAGRRSPE